LSVPIDTGVLDLLSVSLANLKNRAKRLSLQLVDTEFISGVEIVERTNPLGASPWNRYRLPSAAVMAAVKIETATLLNKLRSGELGSSILCASQDGRVLIDLRFVPPRDDQEIVRALTRHSEGTSHSE
jgi:hypothetical protein